MEMTNANETVVKAAEEIVNEGFKMGKGTKCGLLAVGTGLVVLAVYKATKFFKNKKESEEMEDAAAEHDEVADENVEV